jgi:hypothetical protein
MPATFVYPCPGCLVTVQTEGDAGNQRRCPQCKQIAFLIDFDNSDLRPVFPFIRWAAIDDGRSAQEHIALMKSGINGSTFFHRDDPVLAGWWTARRKGVRPCRCAAIFVPEYEAKKLGLQVRFVDPLPFDPWKPAQPCELAERRTNRPDALKMDHLRRQGEDGPSIQDN